MSTDRLPDQLGPRVAEHLLGAGVDQHDATRHPRPRCFGRGFENARAVASLRLSDCSITWRVTSRVTIDARRPVGF
jgi:hypothetical protein